MKMKDFVAKVLTQLQASKIGSKDTIDTYVDVESEYTSAELLRLLNTLSDSEQEITSEDDFQLVYGFLSKRWDAISGTQAAYQVNPNTKANLYCTLLVNEMMKALNTVKYKKRDHNSVLMPNIDALHPMQSQSGKLKQQIFAALKQEENLLQEERVMTNALRFVNSGSREFATRMLEKMKRFSKDDKSAMDFDVYRESQHAEAKLKALLEQAKDANEAMSPEVLNPFITFLKQRWDLIDGTASSYSRRVLTRAFKLCMTLADELALAGYQVNSMNRNQQLLLTPEQHHNLDQSAASDNLRVQLVRDLDNGNQLIDELISLPQSNWANYVSVIDADVYTRLLANNGSAVDCLNQQDKFGADKVRNKAILFCLFDMYSKERSKYGYTYKSTLAYVMPSFICKTPTSDEKLQAVSAVQDFLVSGASLDSFNVELNDPQSNLFAHKPALEDVRGILRAYVSQIDVAVAAEQEQLEKTQRLVNM